MHDTGDHALLATFFVALEEPNGSLHRRDCLCAKPPVFAVSQQAHLQLSPVCSVGPNGSHSMNSGPIAQTRREEMRLAQSRTRKKPPPALSPPDGDNTWHVAHVDYRRRHNAEVEEGVGQVPIIF